MFTSLINRFIPNVLLTRRYRSEQMIRILFPKLSGERIDDWFLFKQMSDRQIKTYFDVMDERLGVKITDYDMAVAVPATTEAIEHLIQL